MLLRKCGRNVASGRGQAAMFLPLWARTGDRRADAESHRWSPCTSKTSFRNTNNAWRSCSARQSEPHLPGIGSGLKREPRHSESPHTRSKMPCFSCRRPCPERGSGLLGSRSYRLPHGHAVAFFQQTSMSYHDAALSEASSFAVQLSGERC